MVRPAMRTTDQVPAAAADTPEARAELRTEMVAVVVAVAQVMRQAHCHPQDRPQVLLQTRMDQSRFSGNN